MQMILDEFQAKFPNIKIEAKNVPSTDILKSVVAQAAMAFLPILILYLIAQRQIMDAFVGSGVR